MLFLLCFSYSVFGQRIISGIVSSSDDSIPSASVQIKGTQKGVLTDIAGKYEITIENSDNNVILVFSYIGMKAKEEIIGNRTIIDVVLEDVPLTACLLSAPPIPLKINYWNGLFYNPYGISISKRWHESFLKRSLELDLGYGTNLKDNSDFYGEIETPIFRRNISYKFQQTTFNQSETENKITTHFLESNSDLQFIKIKLLYGIGHQIFSEKALESSQMKNYGIHLGLSKYVTFAKLHISAKSFYWQDYWAWEANLNKSIYYRRLSLNTAISYRQTTQDFKEINLTLGYMF